MTDLSHVTQEGRENGNRQEGNGSRGSDIPHQKLIGSTESFSQIGGR